MVHTSVDVVVKQLMVHAGKMSEELMIRVGHALRVRKKLLQKELNQRAGNEKVA